VPRKFPKPTKREGEEKGEPTNTATVALSPTAEGASPALQLWLTGKRDKKKQSVIGALKANGGIAGSHVVGPNRKIRSRREEKKRAAPELNDN